MLGRALLIAATLGQGVQYKPGSTTYGGMLDPSVVLDVRFSVCGTSPNIRKGGPLTITRASAQNYVCADGIMRSAPANTLAITEQGAQIFGAGTNYILQSEALDIGAPWILDGTGAAAPVVTSNAADAPNGSHTAERIDFPSVTGGTSDSVIGQSVTLTAAPWTFSVFIRGVTGVSDSGAIYVMFWGGWEACYFSSSRWTRCRVTGTPAAGPNTPQIGNNRAITSTDSSAQSVYVWGGQMEAAASESPYLATAGSATSWPATVVSIPNPMSGSTSGMCLSAAGRSKAWLNPLSNMITDGNTGIYGDVTNLNFQNPGATVSFAHGYASDSSHTVTGCKGPSLGHALYSDGALKNTAAFASFPQGSAWYIGNDSGSVAPFNGSISRASLCSSDRVSRCR